MAATDAQRTDGHDDPQEVRTFQGCVLGKRSGTQPSMWPSSVPTAPMAVLWQAIEAVLQSGSLGFARCPNIETLSCSICLGDFAGFDSGSGMGVRLPCGHPFHAGTGAECRSVGCC